MANVLVTGASGFVGAAVMPELSAAGHHVRAFARTPAKVKATADEIIEGDVVTGDGLDRALDSIDVAYYLVHSMESGNGSFDDSERRGAENFAAAAQAAGVGRVVYLGGPVPTDGVVSRHLASRLKVEEALLDATPDAIAFRASIIVGANSRSFRFLVRLVERSPIIPLPAWQRFRTHPSDQRDVLAYLTAAAGADAPTGRHSLDIPGPDVMTYGEMMLRIRDLMLVGRPSVRLPINLTPVAAKVAAAIACEDVGLIEPLMESLNHDLLPRDDSAQELFDVRLHRFDASVERALRDWERVEPLAAR